jgi:hypothetical protein
MTTTAAAEAPTAILPKAKEQPFQVQAIFPGTYPDPGEAHPIYRKAAAVFWCLNEHTFSKQWMRRIKDGEAVTEPEPERRKPETTGRQPRRSEFPPLQ